LAARHAFAVAAAIVAAATLIAIATAGAEEVPRDSYREAVEPICKADTKANERILAGVRQEVKEGKLTAAAAKFRRAGVALKGSLRELKAVPRPAADSARLSRWFGLIATEVRHFERTAGYLAAENKATAVGMVVRLESTAHRANNVVVPFEFHYCRLEPARYT
jgi:hypothetical protein